jgi:hypothetical protein
MKSAATAVDLVVETVDGLLRNAGRTRKSGSMVKQAIKRRNPGFNEAYYGFRSFTALLEAAAKRGDLALDRDEKSANYIVRLTSPTTDVRRAAVAGAATVCDAAVSPATNASMCATNPTSCNSTNAMANDQSSAVAVAINQTVTAPALCPARHPVVRTGSWINPASASRWTALMPPIGGRRAGVATAIPGTRPGLNVSSVAICASESLSACETNFMGVDCGAQSIYINE